MRSNFYKLCQTVFCQTSFCHTNLLKNGLLFFHFANCRQSIGASGNESHWHSVKEALLLLPECSGTFRLGLGSDTIPGMGTVQTVYISHTTERKTLREVVSQVKNKYENFQLRVLNKF